MNSWEPFVLWRALLPPFMRPKTIDGERVKSLYVMRRRAPDGSWQYRSQTKEEAKDFAKEMAW